MGKHYFSTYTRLNNGEIVRSTVDHKARKGYVPVLVGREHDVQKLWLPTKMICHPSIVALLDSSADEFGYTPHGLLKISHEVDPFKRMIKSISRNNLSSKEYY